MRDHISRDRGSEDGRTSVGVRELKAHAARILRQVRESRTPCLVTHRGRAIGVILPVDGEDDSAQTSEAVDGPMAWQAFVRAGRRLETRFAPAASGVRLLSEMRR